MPSFRSTSLVRTPQTRRPARRRRTVLAATAAVLTVSAAACGSSSSSHASATPSSGIKGLKIAMLVKQSNNPVFDLMAAGAKKAAQQLGGQVDYVGPATANPSAQIPYIQSFVTKHYSGIMLSASSETAVAPALIKAMKSGAKVVSFDSQASANAENLYVADSDNAELGTVQIQMICAEIPNCSGQIGIVSATSTSPVQNTWIHYMKVALKSNPKYAHLQLVKIAYGNDDPQQSTTVTEGLIQAYPNLKGIVAPTSVGIVSVAQVVDQTNNIGKIAVTGLGTPNSMKSYVANGTVGQFALWNMNTVGYVAYYVMADLLEHKITGKVGESVPVGDLGTRKVLPGNEIIAGPPLVFSKSNINQFNF